MFSLLLKIKSKINPLNYQWSFINKIKNLWKIILIFFLVFQKISFFGDGFQNVNSWSFHVYFSQIHHLMLKGLYDIQTFPQGFPHLETLELQNCLSLVDISNITQSSHLHRLLLG